MSAAGTPSETPGHTELTTGQKLLITECHTTGQTLKDLVDEILQAGGDPHWARIASTHFQEGLMAAVRSIAKPDFF